MRTLAVIAAGALLAGCSGTAPVDHLAGSRVGRMAETQLEAMHSGMAPGKLACPTLRFKVGASVRCVRTAELSGGRLIRVLGTVEVTSIRNGGRLHVKLDDHVSEFGITGTHLEGDLKTRVVRMLGADTGRVSCPYLNGSPGTSVQCEVYFRDWLLIARITVTSLDKEHFLTRYRFDRPLFDLRVNRGLPSLLRQLRRDGLAA